MKRNSYIAEKLIVYVSIISYVLFGNALTFNIGERLPLKLAEIFSLFVFVIFLLDICFKKFKISNLFSKLNNWIVYWLIIGSLSAVINTFIIGYSFIDLIYGLLYVFRIIHILLFVLVLIYYIKKANISFDSILKCIVYTFAIVCIIGFVQFIFYPIAFDWYEVFYRFGVYWERPDPHQYRLLSTYFDPNYLASILVIPFSLVLSEIMYKKMSLQKFITNVLLLVLYIVTILFTKSRSGIIGIVVSIFVGVICFGLKRKVKIWVLVLVIIAIPVAAYLVLFSNIDVFVRIRSFAEDPSAIHRFDSWGESFEIIRKYPFVGIGYNMYGSYSEIISGDVAASSGYGVDSSLLFIFITSGVIGGLVFIYGIIKILFDKTYFYHNYTSKMIVVSSIVISFFNNLLFNVLWMFPVALICLLIKQKNNSELYMKGMINYEGNNISRW